MKQLTAITDVKVLQCMVRLLTLENALLRKELKRDGCEEEDSGDGSMQLPLDTESSQ